ncbi:MAG: tRNA pseudouridine(38-40) synthase TruA [Clostridiales bacterium]|jgi:tRNA pseudouridine38-40 synthase|nr:tRNA pseudouridine(38-40) synthase TruA [Clostridiales bacterium]
MRILLTIEYRGTNYHGWQRQKNLPTIAQTLEQAIFKVTDKQVSIHGAGRTDAGAHAYNMKAHFDIDYPLPPEKFAYVLNNVLPPDIKIRKSELVDDNFHSRFWAKSKTYIYKIYLSDSPSGVYYDTHYRVRPPLDIDAMKQAAKFLIGEHDFSAFMSQGSAPSSTIRTITDLAISLREIDDGYGQELVIKITGRSFLYNMARVIVAQLVKVGKKIIQPQDIKTILLTKQRKYAKEIAPAHGLYLLDIEY